MTTTTPYRRKLIEVALPLDAINKESAREKSIRHGHPSTLHLWWSRKPLATARAVLFAQMVDDPSSLPDEFPGEDAQEAERQRLFRIIEELVRWENTTNEAVLHAARVEIARSAARNHNVSLPHSMTPAGVADALKQYAPRVLDPFAGGGSIPLEAQRLGLEAHASDLNPVAVLINKALIEIPPKFAGRPPVNPESRQKYLARDWKGAQGLAEDVRYYGQWIRDEAYKRIGNLYPKVRLPNEQGGGEATVIAWLWARTVTCPNPACGVQMPLISSFWLSKKAGKQAWFEPKVVDTAAPPTIDYVVRSGVGTVPEAPKVGRGAQFRCVACSQIAPERYIKLEALEGRLSAKMTVIVAEGKSGRLYLPASLTHETLAQSITRPNGVPDQPLANDPRAIWCVGYGLDTFDKLFTSRQLRALTTLSDLVGEARELVLNHTNGDVSYADAMVTYLALAVDKVAEASTELCAWSPAPKNELVVSTFRRQGLPMTWDFAEANMFGPSAGTMNGAVELIAKNIAILPARRTASVVQADAACISNEAESCISTDPPYYDNIGYSDLSDFFYVWLRRSLAPVYPELFTTLLAPKTEELVANSQRFGGNSEKAQAFFEQGLGSAFARMRKWESSAYPLTVYYAFKQSESEGTEHGAGDTMNASTGWETMLEGLLHSGLSVYGTWPMRSERGGRMNSIEANALASSIVLVCRPRPEHAPLTTRRDFLNELKRELPTALKELQRGNIAPVDLAQAAIGPGMAVFSRYSKVLESDGSQMRVRTALQLINQTLDEVLAEQEGEFDADTRWAVAWFEQYGIQEGPFGVAETLSKAKNTAVGALAEAGILEARGGKVHLLGRDELPEQWNPHQDHRLSVWKVTQHLIRAVMQSGVSSGSASALLDAIGSEYGDKARDLAYRLYTTSERRKWAQEALAYNTLVTEWHDIAGGMEQIRERERTMVRQHKLIEE